MIRADGMKDRADPWSIPIVVAQIPDTGLRREFEAGPAIRAAMAEVAGLREILSARAWLDVTPKGGGRVRLQAESRPGSGSPAWSRSIRSRTISTRRSI